jgi:hypothetical protein
VFDPTGRGRRLRRRADGRLAQGGAPDDADLRRAVIYGSAMGSFAVERFSVERFRDLTPDEIETGSASSAR